MNKTYKINNVTAYETSGLSKNPRVTRYGLDVEVSADQIRAIIKDNPELLEEKKGGRYFFPKKGESYFIPGIDGGWEYERTEHESHVFQIQFGVYRTEQEANLARDKQKAIVACWKWAQENAPFEPDWSDVDKKRYFVSYYDKKKLHIDYDWNYQSQFTLPYFASKEDCLAFIEANKAHLELLFTK